ncbi:hypothetical protein DFJ73DRAFT_761009 [Zopfochytrium polystomum]|nr:hypothetical protein DFJ73DRAFT_761009 [Zopfochytrium polystomum]
MYLAGASAAFALWLNSVAVVPEGTTTTTTTTPLATATVDGDNGDSDENDDDTISFGPEDDDGRTLSPVNTAPAARRTRHVRQIRMPQTPTTTSLRPLPPRAPLYAAAPALVVPARSTRRSSSGGSSSSSGDVRDGDGGGGDVAGGSRINNDATHGGRATHHPHEQHQPGNADADEISASGGGGTETGEAPTPTPPRPPPPRSRTSRRSGTNTTKPRFEVEIDDAGGTAFFQAGEAVTGRCVLSLAEPTRVSAVSVAVRGVVSVGLGYRMMTAARFGLLGDGPHFPLFSKNKLTRTPSLRSPSTSAAKRTDPALLSTSTTLFHDTITLYPPRPTANTNTAADAPHLPAGTHSFPFTFRLPARPTLPPTYRGRGGRVLYEAAAVLERPVPSSSSSSSAGGTALATVLAAAAAAAAAGPGGGVVLAPVATSSAAAATVTRRTVARREVGVRAVEGRLTTATAGPRTARVEVAPERTWWKPSPSGGGGVVVVTASVPRAAFGFGASPSSPPALSPKANSEGLFQPFFQTNSPPPPPTTDEAIPVTFEITNPTESPVRVTSLSLEERSAATLPDGLRLGPTTTARVRYRFAEEFPPVGAAATTRRTVLLAMPAVEPRTATAAGTGGGGGVGVPGLHGSFTTGMLRVAHVVVATVRCGCRRGGSSSSSRKAAVLELPVTLAVVRRGEAVVFARGGGGWGEGRRGRASVDTLPVYVRGGGGGGGGRGAGLAAGVEEEEEEEEEEDGEEEEEEGGGDDEGEGAPAASVRLPPAYAGPSTPSPSPGADVVVLMPTLGRPSAASAAVRRRRRADGGGERASSSATGTWGRRRRRLWGSGAGGRGAPGTAAADAAVAAENAEATAEVAGTETDSIGSLAAGGLGAEREGAWRAPLDGDWVEEIEGSSGGRGHDGAGVNAAAAAPPPPTGKVARSRAKRRWLKRWSTQQQLPRADEEVQVI